jgi:hypothetical protein
MIYDEVYDYATAHRERLCVWLRANGIDPNDVPTDARLAVADDLIFCPVYRRNDAGRLFVDPATDTAARKVVAVPLVAEPGETVAGWLALAAAHTQEQL